MSEKLNNEVFEENQVNQKPDYEQEIITILKSNTTPRAIRDKLGDYHENDISEALVLMSINERKKLYTILNLEELSDVFSYLDLDNVAVYFNELDMRRAVKLISIMDADDAVGVLRQLDRQKRADIIDMMDEKSKRDIAMIASFDNDEIGSKMTTNYVCIKENLSVKDAMKELVRQAADNDNISTIYTVDEENTFYGAIDLKDLIIARETMQLEDIIATSYPYVYGNETIDDCIEKLKDYSEDSIPVLDNDNKVLGVITSQDIIQVVDDEMGEDYAKLAGLTAEEDLKEPIRASVKKRMPWLIILLGLGLLVSSVVGLFEAVVAQLTMIMCFQSLILDMSGNVGTQSLAVTIRVLMDENLTGKQKAGLVFKEMRVGFFNGLILGILSFIFIGIYVFAFKHKTLVFSFAVSGCIGVSLLLAMVISSITGTAIPLFFKKMGVDPAVASGPLITTVNDLVAVITYYGLTWILLINVLNMAG